MADKRTESSAAREDVNRHLRMAVKRFDLSGAEEDTWDFLCECGATECKEWVTLPIKEYEAMRAGGDPILARGHALSRNQNTRRKARSLVEDARALRAQAEHQVRRTARNLRKGQPE